MTSFCFLVAAERRIRLTPRLSPIFNKFVDNCSFTSTCGLVVKPSTPRAPAFSLFNQRAQAVTHQRARSLEPCFHQARAVFTTIADGSLAISFKLLATERRTYSDGSSFSFSSNCYHRRRVLPEHRQLHAPRQTRPRAFGNHAPHVVIPIREPTVHGRHRPFRIRQ